MVELYLYDGNDNVGRRKGYEEVYNHPGAIAVSVASFSEVENEIRNTGVSAGKIDRICFLTHGAPGYIHLPKGGISSTNVLKLTSVCNSYLSKSAQIWLFGCQIAQGVKGEQFLEDLGKAALSVVGGLVLASDSLTWSIPWYGEWLPPWGNAVAAKVAIGGNVTIIHQ